MNREEKSATIEEIAAQIEAAQAIFAVHYRGISVSQAAELRGKLREADASFRVVKNRLTKLAAEKAGEERLGELLEGPVALTFVRGDTAMAAKAITGFNKEHEVLVFRGGFMDGISLDEERFKSIARLPSREVLNGQFAGVVASPLTGLVRGLGSMIQGLALQLGQIAEKGLVSGEAPTADSSDATPAGPVAAGDPPPPAVAEASSGEGPPTAPPAGEAEEADAEAPAEEAQAADAPAEPAETEQGEADPPAPGSEAEEAPSDEGAAEPTATEQGEADPPAPGSEAEEASSDEGAAEPAEAEQGEADPPAPGSEAEEASSDEGAVEPTETEQGEADPPAPGSEAEEAGGTDGEADSPSAEQSQSDSPATSEGGEAPDGSKDGGPADAPVEEPPTESGAAGETSSDAETSEGDENQEEE